ncbi:hypothetical protein GF326_12705 [Candidatus Bathyarchaeota archaeon]|nr:hypothetical protein [Candidatus Bathyarchaeota archaeon]
MNQIRKYAPLALALSLVFLIVFVLPKPPPQRNLSGVIEIGVISPTDETYVEYKYLAGLAEDELNALCNESGLSISFSLNVSSGENSVARSMDIVMDSWRRGVDLFVAGGYHSQLTAMRSFVYDNQLLVVSPSSTNVDMNRDDYIIRMSPNDAEYAPALAPLLIDYGVDRVVLLGRESIVDREGGPFSNSYRVHGGEVIGTVTYPWEGSFNASLGEAESILEDHNVDSGAGVLLLDYISPDEIHLLSKPYNRLSDVQWINIEAYPYYSMNQVPNVTGLKLLSPHPVLVPSEKTSVIGDLFEKEFGEELDFTDGCVYDSCILLGRSIIELDSTNTSLLRNELPGVAESYIGLTGPCGFDSNGDRSVYRMGLFMYDDKVSEWGLVRYYDHPLK